MVINDKDKFLFISIPKNATHSIYKVLCTFFGAVRYGDFHNYEVPERANDYFKFMCLRNPYDRAISAYFGIQQGKTLKHNNPIFRDCKNPKNLVTLFEWAIEKGSDCPTGWLKSQWHFINIIGYKNIDRFLDINNLQNDMKKLPFVNGEFYHFNRLNQSKHMGYKNYLDNTVIKLINRMYKDDFEHLGFEKLRG